MCGRYTNATTWAQVHAFSQPLSLTTPSDDPEPAWNIAPTQPGWVIVADGAEHATACRMRWGLVPSWSRDSRGAAKMINARAETCSSKPAFRAAWKSRRCLVPASGYYEWVGDGAARQPWWIHPADGPVMMFAGLWERWHAPDGEPLQSYSILTCAADGPMQRLHDRRPVMLRREQLGDWLHGSVAAAADIVASHAPPALAWHAVGREVGNVRSQGPQLIRAVAAD